MGEKGGGSCKKERLEIESGSLTDWFCERRSGWEENKGRGKEGGPDGQVLPIIMKCVEIN